MCNQADHRRAGEDTGITESGDRWHSDMLRHGLLASDRRVEDRHDIGATGTHEGKSQYTHAPDRYKRSERQASSRAEAAKDDDGAAADPLYDSVTREPTDGHG